jgi:periplasmic protein TonB
MSTRKPYDDRTFLSKYGVAVFVGVLAALLIGAGLGFYFFFGKVPPPKKPEEIMVHLEPPPLPPPPPPPPPPPKTPPPLEKMVEQPPVKPDEPKPKDVAKTPDKAPGPPGPKATGPASNAGLAGNGGDGVGIGGGSGGGGSLWGWYASEVQSFVRQALSDNPKTRDAALRVKVRLWSDSTGRITRTELSGSTGDPNLDAAIRNEILTGMQLPDAPPQGMPMPIVMRISEQRPN